MSFPGQVTQLTQAHDKGDGHAEVRDAGELDKSTAELRKLSINGSRPEPGEDDDVTAGRHQQRIVG